MSYTRIFALVLCLLISLTACDQSPDDARMELGKMNVPYTSEVFITHAKEGDIVVVKLFLKSGMDVNAIPRFGGGVTALMAASENGRLEVVELLLSKGADANAKKPYGGTALSAASAQGHLEVVRVLKAAGATE